MGEGRACRHEPDVARELEQRENRGGGGTYVLGRDGRRPRARSSRRRQGPPVRSPSLFHLLACRVPSESLPKNGQPCTTFYQNVCEVAVRVKTFLGRICCELFLGQLQLGLTGRFASRIPHPARRDGRLMAVGSPIRGGKWNRQTIRRGR